MRFKKDKKPILKWGWKFRARWNTRGLNIRKSVNGIKEATVCNLRNMELTERHVGPTWDVRFCFKGPPLRNSSLGVITQKPTMGLVQIQPCSLRSRLSLEYWYLSSTCSTTVTVTNVPKQSSYLLLLPVVRSWHHALDRLRREVEFWSVIDSLHYTVCCPVVFFWAKNL